MPKPHDIIAIVGQITPQIASQIKRQAGDIVLEVGNDRFGLVHIKEHDHEFEKLGITALDFVKIVGQNYNEIRKGKDGSLMLLKRNGASKIAYIKLKVGDNYSVSTAFVANEKYLEKFSLLWGQSEPDPAKGLKDSSLGRGHTSCNSDQRKQPTLNHSKESTKITKNHTQAMTTKRKPLATKPKTRAIATTKTKPIKGLSGVKENRRAFASMSELACLEIYNAGKAGKPKPTWKQACTKAAKYTYKQ